MKRFFLPLLFVSVNLFVYGQVTQVTLTLTPSMGGDAIVASATFNDGMWSVDETLELDESSLYEVSISLNAQQATLEARQDEIQFFYDGETGLFDHSLEYQDQDANDLPVGFSMEATTACVDEVFSGVLSVTLVDFGMNKSGDGGIADGQTIFAIEWPVTIIPDPDAPPCENEEEIITDVILTWTSEFDTVVARAQDPDGEGPLDLVILDEIDLLESTEYQLSIQAMNSIEGEDITEEIRLEADEHMFFFAFTDDLMQSPSGDGNADNRMDPINYQDEDENGLPLGLSTSWISACVEEDISGTFRLILKHQPEIKSETSDAQDGSTDLDLIFTINVTDQADAPGCENEEEIITDVILTWTSEFDTVVARAQDPDGEGPLDLEILDDIVLLENTTYTMAITVENSIEGEDITDEIREESDEHMFFFAFTEGIFSDPPGDGNADSRGDSVHYLDFDNNALPVGLSTQWSTQTAMGDGTFRIVLKHQPEVKSATSTIDDGGTDIDLTFNLGSIPTAVRDFIAPSDQLEIRPNPVVDYLEWNFKEGVEPVLRQIQILDLYGRSVMEVDYKDNLVSTSQLPAGQYLLKLSGKDKIWIKRFIKN